MRVEKPSSVNRNIKSVHKKDESPASSFSSFMQEKKDTERREELDKMMKKIKEKGVELVDSKNLDLLLDYKRSVKEFVSSAVNFAFEIVDRKGHSRLGRTKILKIVSQIDDELVRLTEEFLEEEKSKLNLLNKIGQLCGLLTNIYV